MPGIRNGRAKSCIDAPCSRMSRSPGLLRTGDHVKLTGYKARGGKLLFPHGLADPIFSPDEMVDYCAPLLVFRPAGSCVCFVLGPMY
jgi:hypothetical protein